MGRKRARHGEPSPPRPSDEAPGELSLGVAGATDALSVLQVIERVIPNRCVQGLAALGVLGSIMWGLSGEPAPFVVAVSCLLAIPRVVATYYKDARDARRVTGILVI